MSRRNRPRGAKQKSLFSGEPYRIHSQQKYGKNNNKMYNSKGLKANVTIYKIKVKWYPIEMRTLGFDPGIE